MDAGCWCVCVYDIDWCVITYTNKIYISQEKDLRIELFMLRSIMFIKRPMTDIHLKRLINSFFFPSSAFSLFSENSAAVGERWGGWLYHVHTDFMILEQSLPKHLSSERFYQKSKDR